MYCIVEVRPRWPPAGRLTNVVYADGSSLTNYYDAVDRITNTADGTGVSVKRWFTDNGLLYAASNAVGQVFDRAFDIEDRVTNKVDSSGVATANTYDNIGRLLTRRYPDNGVDKLAYNAAGVSVYTNQLGYTNAFSYDPEGRKIGETNSNGEITKYGYDLGGDITTLTDGDNHTTQWGYDLYGRMTNKIDALLNPLQTNAYDADNRLTIRWTPAMGQTQYGYDRLGNLLSVVYQTSSNILYGYDALNRMTNMTDGIGATSFTYTPIGELSSETGPWGNSTVSYIYSNQLRTSISLQHPNGASWYQSYSFDAVNRLKTTKSPAGTFTYTYDLGLGGEATASSIVDKLQLPTGAIGNSEFDNNGRPIAEWLQTPAGVTLERTAYAYNQDNLRTTVWHGANGSISNSYIYDPTGQVIKDDSSEGRPRLNEQLAYAYDHAQNLLYRTNNTLVQSFQVNADNELTAQTNGGGLTVLGTTTSTNSSVTINGTNAQTYSDYTIAATNMPRTNSYAAVARDSYGRVNSYTASVSLSTNSTLYYDANGNLTNDGLRDFLYDDENELISITVLTNWMSRFQYDGKMRLRIRREFTYTNNAFLETNEVHYIYDGSSVIEERDANNIPRVAYSRGTEFSSTIESAGGIGSLLARTDEVEGSPAFYHSDANGNVVVLVNSSNVLVARYLYDAFGGVLSAAGSLANANLYQFSSKEKHLNSGLVYYLYRFYDPNFQRWLNRDPIGEIGGIDLYTFSGNNPVSCVDVDGRFYGGAATAPAIGWATSVGEASMGAVAGVVAAGAVAGTAIGYGASQMPVYGGGNVADFYGDAIYDAFYASGQGERSWEKGRGDDPYWGLTEEELREIERDPKSTPSQKERAKRIRKQKEKKRKCQ